jgi:DNA (cytosine-5)-methyltransferase 1
MLKERNPALRIYQDNFDFDKDIIVDFFAGGGGASTGLSQALGRDPDYAINHDAQAIAMHKANHPDTKHFISDVFEINPSTVARGRKIKAWFSPDCTHHSKARGCSPVSERIRGLAWVVLGWAMTTDLTVFALENVEEFQDWGPTILNEKGNRVPDAERKGQTFNSFIKALSTGIDKDDPSIPEIKRFLSDMLEKENINIDRLTKGLGYQVEYKTLIAYEYGAPTTRKRFFLIARKDEKKINFPKATHSRPDCETVKQGKKKAWKTAAECIEWDKDGYSIFATKKQIKEEFGVNVKRPLQDTTMKRIAKGFKKFVLENDEPFIITNNFKVSTPFLQTYYGQIDKETRGQSLDSPLSTITAGGLRHGLVTPYLIGIDNKSAKSSEWTLKKPITTIVTENRHALIKCSFLSKYYGTGENVVSINTPLPTATTKDRFSLVNINLSNIDLDDNQRYNAWNIVRMIEHYNGDIKTNTIIPSPRANCIIINDCIVSDISLRMLNPRELFRGQGFPDDYIIEAPYNGKKLPKTAQVRMCGNSVPPNLPYHIAKANFIDDYVA